MISGRGRAASVAALVGAVILAVAGPAGAVGSAQPAACAAAPRAAEAGSGAASRGDDDAMAGMAGMAASPASHPMKELADRLARTPTGGTLTVQPGVYRGGLVIDRRITLVGVGHPILQGDGTGTVLTIRAAGTTVRDLMVEGSGPGPVDNPAGVSVEADDVVVRDNHIRDSYTGIWVEGVRGARITGNVIDGRKSVAVSGASPAMSQGDMGGMKMGSGHGAAQAGRGDGVSLFDATAPLVSGNTISDVRDGVYLSHGSDIRIECNSVVGSRYAVHGMYGVTVTVLRNRFTTDESGTVMMYGGPVTVDGNVIREQVSAATGFGVLLLDVGGARLVNNVIVSNRVGLQIEGAAGEGHPAAVERNTVALNQIGVGVFPTADAVMSRNSFVQNTVQVLGLGPDGGGGPSRWSRDGVGNYWSDYRGFDRAGNGIGDIPHVEGAAAGRLLAGDPALLALATSPSFTLLRAVEQRSAGQHPVVVDRFPLMAPRSPSLPPVATRVALGTGLLGGLSLLACSLVLVRCAKRRPPSFGKRS
ncbi:NosD domain-containing protein [Pengzhenrongella sp.]|uniref:NosD domain-containing protein n=1 Tax=Pengzhenrongella sp. TaxID=2888820 RepID=UPI002F9322B3